MNAIDAGKFETDTPTPVGAKRRVLVGEFRDEVFADLEGLFAKLGYDVSRATFGGMVSSMVHDLRPNLVLVNERFADQSGWLVASKLQMFTIPPKVWLYACQLPSQVNIQKSVCGIEEVLSYRGILSLLHRQILDRIALLQSVSDNEDSRV
ncbi:hypothetical protein N9N28_07130 [Rubripirellula amarantea]|nr:hypothetical protein [Rubripirellula amarantea]